MRKILLAVSMSLLSLGVTAKPTTSEQKRDFYKGCMPSCQSKQKNSPDNLMLKDVPFVMDSYCSCYCARISMRLTTSQYAILGRAAIEGRDPTQDNSINRLVNESAEKCLVPFFD